MFQTSKWGILCENYPFIEKIYTSRSEHVPSLPTLLEPKEYKETDIQHTIINDLLVPRYNPNNYEFNHDYRNNKTCIDIILNKSQLRKARATLSNAGIDVNDFNNLLIKYKETIVNAYAHYGCKGRDKIPMRLQDINDTSRDYSQRPIIYADKDYWVFQMFQYKIYDHLKEYIETFDASQTTDYDSHYTSYLSIFWNDELIYWNEQIVKQYNDRSDVKHDDGKKNLDYCIILFINLPIYTDFHYHIFNILKKKFKTEMNNGVKYEEYDDILLKEYIKKHTLSDQKQEDKSHIYEQYAKNKTLNSDELDEINLTSVEFNKQRFIMHYVHPNYDVCKSQTTYNYKDKLLSFDNPQMILELRQLQIKINYLFYVIASQLYDAYIWHTTPKQEQEDQQNYLFGKLEEHDVHANENKELYENVYNEIILLYNQIMKAPKYPIFRIKTKIKEFIIIYKNNLLKKITEKYLVDKKNLNLVIVLKTHRFYLLYKDNIQIKINDLYQNLIYLQNNRTVMFDTINDPKYFFLYLRFKHNLWIVVDADFLKEEKKYVDEFNEKKEKILEISNEYRSKKGNVRGHKYFQEFGLNMEILERERFLTKVNYPFVYTLNYGDQTDINTFIEGLQKNPKLNFDKISKYNIGCKYFREIPQLQQLQQGGRVCTVYGFTGDVIKFKTCNEKYSGNDGLWYMTQSVWYLNFSLEHHFDLSLSSNFQDHLRVYVDMKVGGLIFASNEINKVKHAHYIDDEKVINHNINYLKNHCIYIGFLKIPCRNQKDIIILIVWDKNGMCFWLYDMFGSPLYLPIILYNPYSSYYEMLHMLVNYEAKFYKYPNGPAYPHIYAYIVSKQDLNGLERELTCKMDNPIRIGIGDECKQHLQVGGNNEIIKLKYIPSDKMYTILTNKKIAYSYNIIQHYKNIIARGHNKWYWNILNLMDPYRLLYVKTNNHRPTNYNITMDLIEMQKETILYHNIMGRNTILMWMMQHKYNLITKQTYNIYEINGLTSINDAFVLINNKYTPTKVCNYNIIRPDYIYKNTAHGNIPNIPNIPNVKTTNCNSKKEFNNELHNIKTIDFLFIHLLPYWFCAIDISIAKYTQLIYILWIFCNICDKLTVGSSVCIIIGYAYLSITPKIYALIAYLFEEYHIYKPDINAEFDNDIFLILKNKKNMKSYETLLKSVYNEFEINIPDLYTNQKYLDICSADKTQDKLLLLSNIMEDKIIIDIYFDNTYYKKICKKIKKQLKISNKLFYKQIKRLFTQCKELNKKIEKTPEIDYNIEYYKKNLFTCIQWSKKYEFPLKKQVMDISNKLTKDILYDMLLYEPTILFRFKKNDYVKKIDSDMLEKFYNKALSKYLFETGTLDTRNMNVYNQVKSRIEHYYHKLTKKIKKEYNIKGFVSHTWIKLLEIYSVIDIIPKNENIFKSFHFCESPGTFVYATKYFINTKTQIKDWKWKAQCLNTKNTKIPKEFEKQYEFGNGSGDINEPENLEYYKTNCGENDFVTADCELLSQKNIFSLSIFLSVLSILKNGGTCIIKRQIPIDNAQEIFILNLFYNSFEQTIAYKPRVNQQTQEYYIIGINYKKQDLSILVELQKNYIEPKIIDKIPEHFLLQLDKLQHTLLDSFNNHIKNKIYFVDNFTKLTDNDWKMINKISKEKIKEWLELVK